ncbi:MAG: PadR family transcriptional regulator [Gemmatimonadota bacterium]
MNEERGSMLQGTLELLILKIVSLEPIHGWGITLRMEQMSSNVFLVNQGSLYPALERLTRRGWLRSEWRTTESNRRARYYEVTAPGRRRLATELEGWQRSSSAVNAILSWSGALP